jgi:hypothetical protein
VGRVIQDRWRAGYLHLNRQPTQMAIPLQMELKSFVNSWSLQCGAWRGFRRKTHVKE